MRENAFAIYTCANQLARKKISLQDPQQQTQEQTATDQQDDEEATYLLKDKMDFSALIKNDHFAAEVQEQEEPVTPVNKRRMLIIMYLKNIENLIFLRLGL